MEVSDQLNNMATLLPGKVTPVPIGEEGVWVLNSAWTLWSPEKILFLVGKEFKPSSLSVYRMSCRDSKYSVVIIIQFK
jgi:hypothetical protein